MPPGRHGGTEGLPSGGQATEPGRAKTLVAMLLSAATSSSAPRAAAAAAAGAVGDANANAGAAAAATATEAACKKDADKHCNVSTYNGYRNGTVLGCLRDVKDKLSAACGKAIFR